MIPPAKLKFDKSRRLATEMAGAFFLFFGALWQLEATCSPVKPFSVYRCKKTAAVCQNISA